jgi:PAS domain S-box-containing protein
MISIYDIISGNLDWLAERLDFYVLKMDCLRNTGFSREKQKMAICVISDCIGESCKRNNGPGNIEPDDDENNYRFTYRFLEAYYSFSLGINRNNILRLIKLCKRVYIELVQSLDISLKEQKDCCMFVDAFFDNFEISIFDNWYSVNSLKENGNFTYDEFRKIALMVSQTAALGIIVVKDKQLFYINEYIEKLSGYDLFELKNLNPLSIIDGDYQEFFIKKMELCSKGTASSENYTLKINNKFGEVKYVDISEQNIFTDGSKIILMTVADITAYRQVQDKLLKNSESLRTLIDAMTDIVCFKDESGRWLDANETAVDLFDLHDVDYRGMTNSELAELNNGYFKDVCNYCNDTDEKTWQSGHVLEYEEVINKPDGSKLIYEITKVPLYYGDGKRKSIVALGKDVTNKKESENNLRESEERYRKLFDLSPDAIFIRNGNTIALANQAGIKFFGKETLDEIKGMRGSEFVTPHPDYKPDIEEFRKKLEKDGFIPLIEEKFIRKSDGKILEYETTCSVFPYEGTNTILVISRDISERNKAEKLKSEMNEKDMQLLEAIE